MFPKKNQNAVKIVTAQIYKLALTIDVKILAQLSDHAMNPLTVQFLQHCQLGQWSAYVHLVMSVVEMAIV